MSAEEELRETVTYLRVCVKGNAYHQFYNAIDTVLAALEKAQADSARLTSFTGELIWAGTKCIEDTDATGVFIEMTVNELKAIKYLPMYKQVTVSFPAT